MAAKLFLVICASTLFFKATLSQCIGGAYNAGIIANGLGLAANEFGYGLITPNAVASDALAAGYGPNIAYGNVAPAAGRGFSVTSTSAIAPMGISVTSENAIEGLLAVTGQLPVLAAVALEGALPTAGSGSIMYGCGNGAIGIVSEGVESLAAPAASLGYENALAAELGYGTQIAGGLGYGAPLAGGLGYGAPLAGGLGYGAPLAGGLGYGAPMAGGLGYRGLAGAGSVVGPGYGCGI